MLTVVCLFFFPLLVLYIFADSILKESSEEPPKALARSLPGGKNPVSVLMEHSQRSGHAIEFINTGQEGPAHDPRYEFSNISCLFFLKCKADIPTV